MVAAPLVLMITDPPWPAARVLESIWPPLVSDKAPSCKLMLPALALLVVMLWILPPSTLNEGAVIEMEPAFPVAVFVALVLTPLKFPALSFPEIVIGPDELMMTDPPRPPADVVRTDHSAVGER